MPTTMYVPHAINFASGVDITQLDSLDPAFNIEELVHRSASEVMPGFSGNRMSKPSLSMSTTQIKDILDKMDQDYVAKGYSATNIDLEYRRVTSLTGRSAIGASENVRIRTANSLLSWESISARQGSDATINFRLMPVSVSGAAPFVYTGATTISATSAVQALFECGPVVLDGTTLCVTGWDWNNNCEYNEIRCSGSPYIEHASIKSCKPTVEFDVEDITVALAKLPAGAALSSLVCYLRKKSAGGINVADATTEHIALSASVGAITPVGPRRVRVNINSFSLSTGSAIS